MSFVQTANSSTGVAAISRAVAFPAAQTAGNLNAIVISFGNASAGGITNFISSVTDTLGNTYSPANSFLSCLSIGGGQALGQIIYYAPNIHAAGAGANTVTVTLSSSCSFFTIAIFEYSGLALASPIDVTAAQKQDATSVTVASTGSLTTTVASDMLFGAFAFFDGAATPDGTTAGFTVRAKYYTELISDQVGVAVGPYSLSGISIGSGGWIGQLVAFKPAGGGPLSFPLVIADTSTVTKLAFRIGQRFALTVADTSTITALGFRVGVRIPLTVADTSTVTALGFHILGVLHFPLVIADASTVTTLGFRVTRRFALVVADTSTVTRLAWSLPVQRFPIAIADISHVTALGFENDHAARAVPPRVVPPYAGQDQSATIHVTADIAWRESQMEEGCWAMLPYASLYPPPTQAPGEAFVPPPVYTSDLWSAMQEWPL